MRQPGSRACSSVWEPAEPACRPTCRCSSSLRRGSARSRRDVGGHEHRHDGGQRGQLGDGRRGWETARQERREEPGAALRVPGLGPSGFHQLIRALRVAFMLVSALVIGAAPVGLPGPAGAQSVGDVFRKVNPAVLVIRAKGQDVEAAAGGLTRFTETGSGVLVSADGKVMTAAHVVHSMDEINVEFLGGETVSARVVSSEPAADLSLLQLQSVPKGVKPALLADSDTVRVGDQILIVGAPYGLSHSMSAGWISARWPANSVYRSMPLAEFLQTDATINTGNSGGPMFNMAGEVIGIVSHNISKSGGSEGLGFVVTINTAKTLLLERPSFWSGLDGRLISGPIAQILNLPQPTGYLVKSVARGSAGDAVGLIGGAV